MGNIFCPPPDIASLASIARDICPFPNYNPTPLFVDMLSTNSSLHLRNHYEAVQSSLNPKQLEDFTQGLRTTFGRDGNVTLGGVGVVALSLAVLFDTLARQVRGEWVSESGPIPGLFVKDPRGYYPPQVYTISEYLRLVPHIANNPKRMKQETERYHKQLMTEDQTLQIKEGVTMINAFLSHGFEVSLQNHYKLIKNATAKELFTPDQRWPEDIIITFNCDTETANKDFLAELQKSDEHTRETMQTLSKNENALLQEVARAEITIAMFLFRCPFGLADQRGDFDLRANALGKWPE